MSKSKNSPLLEKPIKLLETSESVQVLWKLQDVMYRFDISSKELSKLLEKTPSAVVKLKKQRVMPRVNSAYLSSLLLALNEIRERKLLSNQVKPYDIEKYSRKILLEDLIEVFWFDCLANSN